MGNKVHNALVQLGGSAVVDVGEGDDDEDIEADFEGWKAQLYESLNNSFLVSKSKVRLWCFTCRAAACVPLTAGVAWPCTLLVLTQAKSLAHGGKCCRL